MNDITQKAQSKILAFDEFMTAEDCYNYLLDDDNFIDSAKEIKRTISSRCNIKEDDTKGIINTITEKIISVETKKTVNKDNLKKTVSTWINGKADKESDSRVIVVISREQAIKLCFALEMDLDETNTFLRKACGLHGLNVRNAKEAVYFYCLNNKRPYSAAEEILDKYESAPCDQINNSTVKDTSSNTTKRLANTLNDTNWETDELFLETFLIPNKPNFINYSKTALSIFHEQKRELLINCISRALKEEQDDRQVLELMKDSTPISNNILSFDFIYTFSNFVIKYPAYKVITFGIKNELIILDLWDKLSANTDKTNPLWNELTNILNVEIMQELWTNFISELSEPNKIHKILRQLPDGTHEYKMKNKYWHGDLPNTSFDSENEAIKNAIFSSIKELPFYQNYGYNLEDMDNAEKTEAFRNSLSQRLSECNYKDTELDNLLSIAMPLDTMFREVLGYIPYIRGKVRDFKNYSEAKVKAIYENFPRKKYFSDIEKSPEKNTYILSTRKTIVFMFFLNYIFNWNYEVNDEKSFDDFYYKLTDILDSCNMASLYPADRFDWMILHCIQKFDNDYYEDTYDAIEYFYDIIDVTFSGLNENLGDVN